MLCNLALGLALSLLSASPQPGQVVQPAAYTSPSGEYVLFVDPGLRTGSGPASYTLLRAGNVVWRAEQPFTLWEAGVLDDGRSFGHGRGRPCGSTDREAGLVVAALGAEGELLLEHHQEQHISRYLHSPAEPHAHRLAADGQQGRFAMRVVDSTWGEPERTNEMQRDWTFDLGKPGGPKVSVPKQTQPLPRAQRGPIDLVPISGRPLRLVSYRTARLVDPEARDWTGSVALLLLDQAGKVVWSAGRPQGLFDVSPTVASANSEKLPLEVLPSSAEPLIGAGAEGRFLVGFEGLDRCAEFSVQQDPDTQFWQVERLADRPEGLRAAPRTKREPPEIQLELLGSHPLDSGPEAARAPKVSSCRIDAQGRILLYDHQAGQMHAFDGRGRRLWLAGPVAGEWIQDPLDRLLVDANGSVLVPAKRRTARDEEVLIQFHPTLAVTEVDFEVWHGYETNGNGNRWWLHSSWGLERLQRQRGELALTVIERTPFGRWLPNVQCWRVDNAGDLLVLTENAILPEAGQDSPLDEGLFLYPGGHGPGQVLSTSKAQAFEVCGDWIVAQGFGPKARLIRRRDAQEFLFQSPSRKDSVWRFGFSPDGQELWVVSTRPLELQRFALPPE